MSILRQLVKQLISVVIAFAIIALIVVGGIKLWQKFTAEAPEQPSDDAVAVDVIEVELPEAPEAPEQPEEEETASVIEKTGFLIADQEVDVFAEVSGVIKSLTVMEGQEISAGQAVAQLGDSTQLATAQATYNAAIASLENAQRSIILARQSTDVSLSSFQNQITSAENSIRQAAYQLDSNDVIRTKQFNVQDLQQKNTELQEKLQAEQSGTDEEMRSAADEDGKYAKYLQKQIDKNNDAITAQNRTIGELQGDQQDSQSFFQVLESQNQINSILKQMESAKIQGATQLNSIESQIIQLQSQLETARINIAAGRITSPIAGTITNLDVRVGDRVGPNVPVFTITNLNSLVFQASITPNELMSISDSNVFIEMFGQKVPAEIIYVGATADANTKTIPVKVIPSVQVDAPMVPNTFAKIVFEEKVETTPEEPSEEPEVEYFTLPVRIMKFEGGKFKVPVAEEGVLVYKEVTFARSIENGQAPIATGLKDGDYVIMSRLNLEEGSKVQPR